MDFASRKSFNVACGKGYGIGISQDLGKTSRTKGASFGIGLSELRQRLHEVGVTWTFNLVQRTLRSPSQVLGERRPARFTSRL